MNRRIPIRLLPVLLAAGAGLLVLSTVPGCGTIEEGTEEEWTQPTDVPPEPPQEAVPTPEPAPPEMLLLQFKVDSLMSENRRLRQQVDAMAAEMRALTARNSDLEMRLQQAAQPPPRVETPAPSPRTEPTRRPVPPRAVATPPSGGASDAYSDALDTYRRRDFREAAALFDALVKSGTAGQLTPNCHYWLGESYYGMGKYAEAIRSFEEVLGYPSSEKKDDAQMMIGNSYLGQRNGEAARQAFTKLVDTYPRSPFVQRAREKMAAIR